MYLKKISISFSFSHFHDDSDKCYTNKNVTGKVYPALMGSRTPSKDFFESLPIKVRFNKHRLRTLHSLFCRLCDPQCVDLTNLLVGGVTLTEGSFTLSKRVGINYEIIY